MRYACWNAIICTCVKSPKTILHDRDAIFRARDKLLIFNMILQLWADVKYHVPTGFCFFAEGERFLSTETRNFEDSKSPKQLVDPLTC